MLPRRRAGTRKASASGPCSVWLAAPSSTSRANKQIGKVGKVTTGPLLKQGGDAVLEEGYGTARHIHYRSRLILRPVFCGGKAQAVRPVVELGPLVILRARFLPEHGQLTQDIETNEDDGIHQLE